MKEEPRIVTHVAGCTRAAAARSGAGIVLSQGWDEQGTFGPWRMRGDGTRQVAHDAEVTYSRETGREGNSCTSGASRERLSCPEAAPARHGDSGSSLHPYDLPTARSPTGPFGLLRLAMCLQFGVVEYNWSSYEGVCYEERTMWMAADLCGGRCDDTGGLGRPGAMAGKRELV